MQIKKAKALFVSFAFILLNCEWRVNDYSSSLSWTIIIRPFSWSSVSGAHA